MQQHPHYLRIMFETHYDALLHASQQQQRIAFLQRQKHNDTFWTHQLDRLGCVMIAWGWRLHLRYGNSEAFH